MKEFIEKLIGRLENRKMQHLNSKESSEKLGYCGTADFFSANAVALNQAIKIVTELAEEYNNGWIPCSSGKFPTDEVLVCREDGTIDFDVFDFMYEDWKFNSNHHKNKVIAWQPLPQPFKEEGASNE